MRTPAYLIGALDAFNSVGLQKHANAGLLRELAVPMTAGAGLGAIGGAAAAGEGQGFQGALTGAGLGALGGGVGHGLGRLAGKAQQAAAEKGLAEAEGALAKLNPDVITPQTQKAIGEAEANVGKAQARKSKADQATASGVHGRGGAMLGGVAGTGTGMGIAATREPEPPPELPPGMNPYGY